MSQRDEIIDMVHELVAGIDRNQAKWAVEAVMAAIFHQLTVERVNVTMRGYCTFKRYRTQARNGANPRTLATIGIPARTLISLRLATKVKDQIRNQPL